jgi:hypothetical protein
MVMGFLNASSASLADLREVGLDILFRLLLSFDKLSTLPSSNPKKERNKFDQENNFALSHRIS